MGGSLPSGEVLSMVLPAVPSSATLIEALVVEARDASHLAPVNV